MAQGLEDPGGLVRGIEYRTRQAVERMAQAFQAQTGLVLRVRSGRRTCAEQDGLYAQGRTAPGEKVTYAAGCNSWHVLGRAIDADAVDPSTRRMVSGCDPYAAAGAIWESMGGVWGGRFKGFGSCGDAGHFEWHPGMKIADVCPDPANCAAIEPQIQASTTGPTSSAWMWAGIGALLVGAWAWYR